MNKWKQDEDDFSIFVKHEEGHIVADVRCPPGPITDVEKSMHAHRSIGRLMAAAPDLYDALYQTREERLTPGSTLYKMATKAIRKAQFGEEI